MGHNKRKKSAALALWSFGHHWWEQCMSAWCVWVAAPHSSDLTCGWRRNCPWAVGRGLWRQRAGQGKASDMQGGQSAMALSDVFWGGLTWVLHVPQRMVCQETLGGKSPIGSVTLLQTQTPGGAGLGTSGAQLSSGTWLSSSGQLHPPPHRPQLPAEGQAGLLQAWPKCCNFPSSLWAAPHGEEGDEAVREVAQGFGGRDSHKVRD